jgi:hypothetical protein
MTLQRSYLPFLSGKYAEQNVDQRGAKVGEVNCSLAPFVGALFHTEGTEPKYAIGTQHLIQENRDI